MITVTVASINVFDDVGLRQLQNSIFIFAFHVSPFIFWYLRFASIFLELVLILRCFSTCQLSKFQIVNYAIEHIDPSVSFVFFQAAIGLFCLHMRFYTHKNSFKNFWLDII